MQLYYEQPLNAKKIIKNNFKHKLQDKSHCVDSYFDAKEFQFAYVKTNVSSAVPQSVVYCTDFPGFIAYVKEKRNVYEGQLKLGMDGGEKCLKLCLSVQSIAEREKADSVCQRYEEGLSVEKFKDSGVIKYLLWLFF